MLVNLQLLRFLAALPVIAYHTAPHIWASGESRDGLLQTIQLFGFGGVDIFFVISGFIMWHTTLDDRGPADAWRFLRRRAARIYSGYWPFLLLALSLWFLYHPDIIALKNLPVSAILLPNPMGTTAQLDSGLLVLPVAWTLIYEVYFYIAFFVLIVVRRQNRIAIIWTALFVVGLASLFAQNSGVFTPERMVESSLVFSLYLSPFCIEFLLGCLIGEFHRRHAIKWPLAWLSLGLVMLALISWVNLHWFGGSLLLGYHMPLRVFLFSLAACGFVLWAVGLDQQGKKYLPRLCLLLGGSSYSLYLSHTLWLQWLFDLGVRDWLTRHGLILSGYWFLMLLLIVLSVVYYQFVERPMHTGFRKLLRVPKTP